MRGLEEIKKVNSSLEEAIAKILWEKEEDDWPVPVQPERMDPAYPAMVKSYVDKIIAEFRSRQSSR